MDKNKFGERVRQRRQQLGLSQDELAKKLGYASRSTINKIENGTNDVAQKKIVEFANALETSVPYLMSWDKRPGVTFGMLFPELNDTETELIRTLRKADRFTQQMVLKVLGMDPERVDEPAQAVIEKMAYLCGSPANPHRYAVFLCFYISI